MKKDSVAQRLLNLTDTLGELLVLYAVIILLASVGLAYVEPMKFGEAVWLSFVTATSTGYGDFSAKTTAGRVISVLLMHASLFFVIPLFVARILTMAIKDANAFTHEEQEEIKSLLKDIKDKV